MTSSWRPARSTRRRSRRPGRASRPDRCQLHAHDYRNEAQLPPGGVLIVGSGQTGVQLAEELQTAGREIVLSVGHCGRVPRRYRGYDFFWWARQLATRGPAVGAPLPSVGQLPDPRMKFACNPALSGHGGGHETNLRRMASSGIRLAGRFQRCRRRARDVRRRTSATTSASPTATSMNGSKR